MTGRGSLRLACVTVALLSWVGGSLLIAGCSKDSTRPSEQEESPFLPHTSPENLVANVKLAYEHRDAGVLMSLLDERYQFDFWVGEQGDPDPLSKADEGRVHAALLDTSYVTQLSIAFEIGTAVFDSAASIAGDSLWLVSVQQVDLNLYGTTVICPECEPTTFEVRNGEERFWCAKTGEHDGTTGAALWTIVRWEDAGLLRVAPDAQALQLTWGEIKLLFLEP